MRVGRMRCRRYVEAGDSGRGLYEDDIVVPARLVLHFDINKTVTRCTPPAADAHAACAGQPPLCVSSSAGIQATC